MDYRTPSTPCVVYAVNHRLIGLDPSSGALRWELLLHSTGLDLSFVMNGTSLFVAGNGSTVYRINAVDGSIRWKTDTGTKGLADITLAGPLVIFGRRGTVAAVSAETGTVAWVHHEDRYKDRCPINVSGPPKH